MNISPESLFAALANTTRLRCLMLLVEFSDLCVCEITYALDAAQPTISRQLALLREAGLVCDRREGKWIHYQINPALPRWATNVLEEAHSGIRNQKPFKDDRVILSAMPNRATSPRCA